MLSGLEKTRVNLKFQIKVNLFCHLKRVLPQKLGLRFGRKAIKRKIDTFLN